MPCRRTFSIWTYFFKMCKFKFLHSILHFIIVNPDIRRKCSLSLLLALLLLNSYALSIIFQNHLILLCTWWYLTWRISQALHILNCFLSIFIIICFKIILLPLILVLIQVKTVQLIRFKKVFLSLLCIIKWIQCLWTIGWFECIILVHKCFTSIS